MKDHNAVEPMRKSNGETSTLALNKAVSLVPRDRILDTYRNCVASRLMDRKILVLLKQGKVFFHIGGSGHEIAQTATALAMKPGYD